VKTLRLKIRHFANLVPTSNDRKAAFEMGKDCALNGANEKNCHFAIFSSPENALAWETEIKWGRGLRRGGSET